MLEPSHLVTGDIQDISHEGVIRRMYFTIQGHRFVKKESGFMYQWVSKTATINKGKNNKGKLKIPKIHLSCIKRRNVPPK